MKKTTMKRTPSIIHLPARISWGRKASVVKGVIRGMQAYAAARSPLGHTPKGHEDAVAIGIDLARQVVDAIEGRMTRTRLGRR